MTIKKRPDSGEVDERAAIMEYMGHMTRVQAESETARLYGFPDWRSLVNGCRS